MVTISISPFSRLGKFQDESDQFDSRGHQMNIKVNAGKQINALASTIKVEKVAPSRPTPYIMLVHDFARNQSDTVLTPGSPAEVQGKHLKTDEMQPQPEYLKQLFRVFAHYPELVKEINQRL